MTWPRGWIRGTGWQETYTERFYRRRSGWVDGTTQFHRLCSTVIPRGSVILEVGAGPTNPTSAYLAAIGELHGLDVDPAVSTNSSLKSARVLGGSRYPYADGSFDACVSNYVVEHLESPGAHLAEVRRTLKRGGAYVFRTPNRRHYVALVSRQAPHWLHVRVANPLRGLPEEAHAPYPTYYRLNDGPSIREEARRAGFTVERLEMVEKEPSYGMASRLLFLLGVAYERVVNSTVRLAFLRANAFCVLRAGG